MPVYYRIFPGNIAGMKALIHSMRESGANNMLIIGDKGFYSKDNAKELDQNKLQYIFPLKRDSNLISYERLNSRDYDKAFDGHFFYKDRVIFYYTKEILDEDELGVISKKLIVFYDKSLGLEEENSYLKHVRNKLEGYEIDGYKKKQMKFGTMSMTTNLITLTPQKIYENYKSRMEIETLFDSYKNLLKADRTYMQSDAAIEAWMFINHLSIIIYYQLYNKLKNKNILTSTSPADVLMRLSRINKIKVDNSWLTSEVNSKTSALMKTLDIHIT
jgi:transposase